MSKASIQQDAPTFASLTEEQLTFIERVQIGDVVVMPEQIVEITEVLELADKSRNELTAIRNAVVRHLAGFKSVARLCENAKSFEHYSNALSGITAVIDHHIFNAAA